MNTRQLLNPTDVSEFRRAGCTRLPGLLEGADVKTLQEVYRAAEERPDLWPDFQTEGAQDHMAHTEFQRMFRNTFNIRRTFPELNDIVGSVAGIAAQLFGCDDVRIWWDQVFIKPPAEANPRPTVWHQDQPFWPLDRRGALTFWIAVEDLTDEQGPLRFVERSHRLGSLGRLDLIGAEPPLEELLLPEDFDVIGDIVGGTAMAAGDATVHDAFTLHGAVANRSDRPRRGWAMTFFPGTVLYTGAPHVNTDGRGLEPKDPFDHEDYYVPGREPVIV